MINIFKYPFYLFELASAAKSFLQNPVIGNKRLNAWGLHRWRVKITASIAESRRKRLARLLSPEDRAQMISDGYIQKENFLSDSLFEELKSEIYAKPFAAREMRQGQTVTRMIPLGPRVLKSMPGTRNFIMNTQLREMIHFAASYGGEPLFVINTIIADTRQKETDPQTDLHSDTFHATAKAWLFLHDVGPDDGPFIYVPRSHILTPERLQWEYEQSLTARSDSRIHHSLGSFRITYSELKMLGYVAKTFPVKANTLIIADTRGFHGRTPSNRPTIRVSLDAYHRRNPFLPWTGNHVFSLPFLKYRSMDMYLAYLDFLEHQVGKKNYLQNVGDTLVEDPANI